MTTGNSDTTQLMNESADPITAQVDDMIPTQRSTDWPSLVSTLLVHSNRFSVLASTRQRAQWCRSFRGAAIGSTETRSTGVFTVTSAAEPATSAGGPWHSAAETNSAISSTARDQVRSIWCQCCGSQADLLTINIHKTLVNLLDL